MQRLRILAVLSALLILVGIRSAAAQTTYQIICPLFALYDTDDGWLTYCNAYPTSCDDVPDAFLEAWPVYPEPCDCPDTSGCEVLAGGFTLNNVIKPIKSKVALTGGPEGLDPHVKIAKSQAVYFMKDDEPIYMRLFDFVSVDDKHLDHTCSLVMGIEMKSPTTGTSSLQELKNVQSTEHSYLFTLSHEGRITYLVRAKGVSANDEGKSPTPAAAKADVSQELTSVVLRNHNEKVGKSAPPSAANDK
ncbi:MAG TPA: hypothetical protein VFE46_06395 [Pirellulales bacterium]|jgi:hypothetical protein|nr:hypothetical protein [Pirellulales bacterium]